MSLGIQHSVFADRRPRPCGCQDCFRISLGRWDWVPVVGCIVVLIEETKYNVTMCSCIQSATCSQQICSFSLKVSAVALSLRQRMMVTWCRVGALTLTSWLRGH